MWLLFRLCQSALPVVISPNWRYNNHDYVELLRISSSGFFMPPMKRCETCV